MKQQILRSARRGALALTAGLLAAGAALADEFTDSYCADNGVVNLRALGAQLEGQWDAHYQAGYFVAAGMAMPHPPSDRVETGRLEAREDGLTIVPDSSDGMELTLHWVRDETWSIADRPTLPEGTRRMKGLKELPSPNINGEELGIVAGCELNALPRMVGEGQVTRQGVTADFTLRAIVVGPDLIYGFQEVNAVARGHHVLERRPMVMRRN